MIWNPAQSFQRRLLQSGVPFQIMISIQVIGERTAEWEREGHGTNYGQTMGDSFRELGGICCSLHCTNEHKLQTASFTSTTISKTFIHRPVWVDLLNHNVMKRNQTCFIIHDRVKLGFLTVAVQRILLMSISLLTCAVQLASNTPWSSLWFQFAKTSQCKSSITWLHFLV